MAVAPVPKGYHTVTPYLVAKDAAKLLDFMKAAFGAVETERHSMPDGSVMHGEARIGDSMVMVGGTRGDMVPIPAMLYLYVPDADAVHAKAVKAGGTSVQAVADQFYGDRAGAVKDASGCTWWISTKKEQLSQEEIDRRIAAQGANPKKDVSKPVAPARKK